MHYRISFIFVTFICLFGFVLTSSAQDTDTDESSKPVILYSGTPKKYEIADIQPSPSREMKLHQPSNATGVTGCFQT